MQSACSSGITGGVANTVSRKQAQDSQSRTRAIARPPADEGFCCTVILTKGAAMIAYAAVFQLLCTGAFTGLASRPSFASKTRFQSRLISLRFAHICAMMP